LLGTIAEQVGVVLEGLDNGASAFESVRCHQFDDALFAILLLLAVLCLVQTIGIEQYHAAAGQFHFFAHKFQFRP
jgi:hypothetical protein